MPPPKLITDDEFADSVRDRDALYRDEMHSPERNEDHPEGSIHTDNLGLGRWSTDYETLRMRDGFDHESAKREVRRRIRAVAGIPDPEIPPPPDPGDLPIPPRREGLVQWQGRGTIDNGGAFLSQGKTYMHAAASNDVQQDVYDDDLSILHRCGFNTIRSICYLDGVKHAPGRDPNRDPWLKMGNYDAQAVDRYIAAVDHAYDVHQIRSLVCGFGGCYHWPTEQAREIAFRNLLQRLQGRRHKIAGIAVCNEWWMNWEGTITELRKLCGMAVSFLPDTPVAISAPSVVADETTTSAIAYFTEIRDLYYRSAANYVDYHFSRVVDRADGLYRAYRQVWDNVIETPVGTPDAEEIARALGVTPGTRLTPLCSSNNEPLGLWSSGAHDEAVSRQVLGRVLSFVCGTGIDIWHDDQGVWSDGLLDEYKRPGQRGVWKRCTDQPTAMGIMTSVAKALAMLPGDLPNWSRTRHLLPDHPFAPSFRWTGNGCEQIWPDGVTGHGVVRPYCALKGNLSVMPLLGIKDYFDAVMAHPTELSVYKCDGWELLDHGRFGARDTLRIKQADYSDSAVVFGRYV